MEPTISSQRGDLRDTALLAVNRHGAATGVDVKVTIDGTKIYIEYD
jgi:hypothetical protein